jgi:hypothetical protein
MERFEDDNPKNLYVIRRKLAELRAVRSKGHYEYPVGRYTVHIYSYEIQDTPSSDPADNLLKHETVNVVLNETDKSGATSSISLRDDPLFRKYEPIWYDVIETPNGRINMGNGDRMPINTLCELIKYLHRLTNLTAFL